MPSKPGQRKRLPLEWDEKKKRVFDLIFEGRKTREEIAADCQVPARTLRDWLAHPTFKAALTRKRDRLMEALDDVPYIRKERRLIGLAKMAESARREYEARPWLQEVRPLPQKSAVRIRRKNGDGEEGTEQTEPLDAIVNESFNREAFESFRGALDDIAKELGERRTKADEPQKRMGVRIVIETDTATPIAAAAIVKPLTAAAPGITLLIEDESPHGDEGAE